VAFRDSHFANNRSVYHSNTYGHGVDEFTRNRFIRNGDVIVAGVSAELRNSVFIGNRIGIRAVQPEYATPTATLEGNVFTKNSDAIYVTMPSTLRHNIAVRNSGYGIYAPEATDLGGNVAVGNGTDPQCTGVVCRPR
jgi:hypothetical protein